MISINDDDDDDGDGDVDSSDGSSEQREAFVSQLREPKNR